MPSPFLFACDNLIQHMISGRQRPFVGSCKLTNRCNIHCQQCPFVGRSGPDPSFSQVTTLLDQLSARRDWIVIFEGGEPLLWRIDCADPDGHFWQGCYVEGRAALDCAKCGFSPYTEMSLAFQGHPQAILAGMLIFGW